MAAPLTLARAAGGLLAAGFLLAMALSGATPELGGMVRFTPAGVLSESPEQITRVELRSGPQTWIFTRAGDQRWQAGDAPLSASAAEHMAKALRFLHVSRPTATLDGATADAAALAEMGLDAPRAEVTLAAAGVPPLTIAFGGLNPAATAQYARLAGDILLLPLHVGREWQVLARAVPEHV